MYMPSDCHVHEMCITVWLTGVWKVEWRWVRNGCLQPSASNLFSTIVASTSSSSSTTSFFSALIAKYFSVPINWASSTCQGIVEKLSSVHPHETIYMYISPSQPEHTCTLLDGKCGTMEPLWSGYSKIRDIDKQDTLLSQILQLTPWDQDTSVIRTLLST